MGEGVSMASIFSLLGTWCPAKERSRSVACTTSGQFVGTVIAFCSSPIVAWKWQAIFYIYGFIGLVWSVLFLFLVPNEPPRKNISVGNLSVVPTTAIEVAQVKITTSLETDIPLNTHDLQDSNMDSIDDKNTSHVVITVGGYFSKVKKYTLNPILIPIYVTHVAHNYGYYVLLMWLPNYFHDVLNIDASSLGFYALLPYVAGFVFDNTWGIIADRLIKHLSPMISLNEEDDRVGINNVAIQKLLKKMLCYDTPFSTVAAAQLHVRKISQTVSFVPPMVMLSILAVGVVPSLSGAIFLLTCSIALNTAGHSGYWASIIDFNPREAGFVCGISNTFATLPGIYGSLLTGWLLHNNLGWSSVFCVTIIHYAIGLYVYLNYAKCNSVDEIENV